MKNNFLFPAVVTVVFWCVPLFISCNEKSSENDNNISDNDINNGSSAETQSLLIGSWIEEGEIDFNDYEIETLTFSADGTFRSLQQSGNAHRCEEKTGNGTYIYNALSNRLIMNIKEKSESRTFTHKVVSLNASQLILEESGNGRTIYNRKNTDYAAMLVGKWQQTKSFDGQEWYPADPGEYIFIFNADGTGSQADKGNPAEDFSEYKVIHNTIRIPFYSSSLVEYYNYRIVSLTASELVISHKTVFDDSYYFTDYYVKIK